MGCQKVAKSRNFMKFHDFHDFEDYSGRKNDQISWFLLKNHEILGEICAISVKMKTTAVGKKWRKVVIRNHHFFALFRQPPIKPPLEIAHLLRFFDSKKDPTWKCTWPLFLTPTIYHTIVSSGRHNAKLGPVYRSVFSQKNVKIREYGRLRKRGCQYTFGKRPKKWSFSTTFWSKSTTMHAMTTWVKSDIFMWHFWQRMNISGVHYRKFDTLQVSNFIKILG